MLSILIPIYNFDLRPLVIELDRQARLLDVPCEIICLDDASQSSFQKMNRGLIPLEKVVYEELEKNVGRARIRNLMAAKARFDYLLFMDGDSGVVSKQYLQQYLDLLPSSAVLYGGRVYQEEPPADSNHYLHWWYGKNREEKEAAERANQPHNGFMTNNFLIAKKQFERILFDEQIRQYGHEDTLFGFQLKNHQIDIVHLNNPLQHLGLENKEVFLHKSKLALDNLAELTKRFPELDTKLIRTWKKIRQFRSVFLVRLVLATLHPIFIHNLRGKNPSLLMFDLLKLGYFLDALDTEKKSFK